MSEQLRKGASVRPARIYGVVVLLLSLAACSPIGPIENPENVAGGQSYQAQYRSELRSASSSHRYTSTAMNAGRCTPQTEPKGSVLPEVEILSPGDLLTVSISDDETISGKYEISQDGMLKLMHVPPVPAKGRTVDSVEEAVRDALLRNGLYKEVPRVSIRITDFAPARVYVAGAVFEPGSVSVGGVDQTSADRLRQDTPGATMGARRLSRALQSAGGIRPDADLSRVTVIRGKRNIVIDARPGVVGRAYSDIVLLENDQIEVVSRGCFQENLMVPSPVSPVGIKVFMSNLIVPSLSNSNAAVEKDARELRYGTRFLQAIFGMNCVGGTKLTNSDRTAVLFSRNPITGESIVIERRVEDMLRRADRDNFDPYLMPGDALACYDSSVTNISDVAKVLGGAAATYLTLSNL
ncbi:polysaccharide biosynthesis/export family protein [Agrobacterium salinitolerans]